MKDIITLRDFVSREIVYCASRLIGDLTSLVAEAPRSAMENVSVDYDDLMALSQRADYETPVDWYIQNRMDRDEVVQALEDLDITDDRDPEVINAAEAEAKRQSENYDPKFDDLPLWPGVPGDELCAKLIEALGEYDDRYKEFAEDHRIDPEYDEAYEHWIVTDWLAARLAEKGEITGEVCGLTIWGRCTTGQSISMDWVIQSIYKDLTGAEGEL